jgi:hypothetical protein
VIYQGAYGERVILTQILPFVDAHAVDLYANFERAVYAGRA